MHDLKFVHYNCIEPNIECLAHVYKKTRTHKVTKDFPISFIEAWEAIETGKTRKDSCMQLQNRIAIEHSAYRSVLNATSALIKRLEWIHDT